MSKLMQVEDICKALNDLKIIQKHIDFVEDLDDIMYYKYIAGSDVLAECINVNKHRHYETSITVYDNDSINGIIGVEAISDLFCESLSVVDCYHTLRFFPVEEVISISYKEVVN